MTDPLRPDTEPVDIPTGREPAPLEYRAHIALQRRHTRKQWPALETARHRAPKNRPWDLLAGILWGGGTVLLIAVVLRLVGAL